MVDLLLVALIIRVCSSKFGSSEAVEGNVPRSTILWKLLRQNRPKIVPKSFKIAPGSCPKRQNCFPGAFQVQVFALSSSQVRFLTIFYDFWEGLGTPNRLQNRRKTLPEGTLISIRFRTSVFIDFRPVSASKIDPKIEDFSTPDGTKNDSTFRHCFSAISKRFATQAPLSCNLEKVGFDMRFTVFREDRALRNNCKKRVERPSNAREKTSKIHQKTDPKST